ncbi:nitrate regulatory protein [Variovorax sp. OV329]|uniref:nitrate regulatory protein n=1 Tax=Variovorax sp. OV329 TaxID=1882825 RepID=UPI0008E5A629|nr:nitrate regulatory protein [Variovorax sp. OV329]SFM51786.1 ANTAR domain-containing protein [Variovorax sp. OV329]
MSTGLNFLVAALRCEIDALEELARTSDLVGDIGRLVHALQRERGLSNGVLASGGHQFAGRREEQVLECLACEQAVRAGFDALAVDRRRHTANGSRLFSRIAWVLPGLDALPALRLRIGGLQLDPAQATAAFIKLVAGLLAVVFEAADGATDPDISRRLVALFNFMQGKEFAGQERACGAAAFGAGRSELARQQQWLQLIASQEASFHTFAEFASATLAARWRASQSPAQLAELERLRRVACSAPAGALLDTGLSASWFDGCSQRIDAMQAIEAELAAELRLLSQARIAQARAELEAHERLLARWAQQPPTASADFFFGSADRSAPLATGDTATPAYGRHLERSILQLVQEQAHRLQSMGDELETVRVALNERKLVERAKGLLMAHRRLSEDDAHKMLRQTAMNQKRRLVEVAESVLAMADFLPKDAAP